MSHCHCLFRNTRVTSQIGTQSNLKGYTIIRTLSASCNRGFKRKSIIIKDNSLVSFSCYKTTSVPLKPKRKTKLLPSTHREVQLVLESHLLNWIVPRLCALLHSVPIPLMWCASLYQKTYLKLHMFMTQALSGWMTVCPTHQKKNSKNFVKIRNTLDN